MKQPLKITLRSQIAFFLILVSVILTCTTIAVHHYILLPDFLAFERQQVTKDLERISNAIGNELDHLDTLANDWSAWDDTYRYARDHNIEYEISNLTTSALVNNKLNLLLIIDRSGQKRWGATLIETYEKKISIKPFDRQTFTGNFPLLFSSPQRVSLSKQVKTGVINTNYGLMLFASRPILDSNEIGPSQGTFIMGRFLTGAISEKISDLTGINFKATNLCTDSEDKTIESWSDLQNFKEVRLQTSPDTIEVYKEYLDTTGSPIMALTITNDRGVIKQGVETLMLSVLLILCGVFLSLGMLMFMLQRSVVEPLKSISGHIVLRRKSDKALSELNLDRYLSREVFVLAKEFNALVNNLDEEKGKLATVNFSLMREAKKLKDAETHLRSLDRLKSEFISTAAHELRTPISTIMGYIELLSDKEMSGSFDEEQKVDFRQEIYENSERLAKIIGDVLDVSRIESGQSIPLNKKDTLLDEVISKAAKRFKLKAKQNITFEISDQLPQVLNIDAHRISQVIDNLLSNAIKYSPAKSDISVTACRDKGYCKISVIDEGKGMNEEQVSMVFDKFYRADASDTAIQGLGLGMSIVKQIIEDHGGNVSVLSKIGKGTEVSFRLPLDD
jgi:signal transduction histidine kinase